MVSYHPAKFGSQDHSGSEIIMILVCHVILQDHTLKGSCSFIGGGSYRKSSTCKV